MIIMAIDASTKSSGIAIYKDKELIHYDCLVAKSTEPAKRIKKIVAEMKEKMIEYNVEKIVLEEVRPNADAANISSI